MRHGCSIYESEDKKMDRDGWENDDRWFAVSWLMC